MHNPEGVSKTQMKAEITDLIIFSIYLWFLKLVVSDEVAFDLFNRLCPMAEAVFFLHG